MGRHFFLPAELPLAALRAAHNHDDYHPVPRLLFCVNRGELECNHAPFLFFFRGGGGSRCGRRAEGSHTFFIFGDEFTGHQALEVLEFIDMMISSIKRGTRCSCGIYRKSYCTSLGSLTILSRTDPHLYLCKGVR